MIQENQYRRYTMSKKKKTDSETKESKNIEKGVNIEDSTKLEEKESRVLAKKEKEYTQAPNGTGGQFVEIGGGIKVPVSEIDQK